MSGLTAGRRPSRCPCSGLGCESSPPARSGPRCAADAGNPARLHEAPEGPCHQGGSGRRCPTSCCHWSAAGSACCRPSSAVRDAPVPDLSSPGWWTLSWWFPCTGETPRSDSWSAAAAASAWRLPQSHSLPLPPLIPASPPRGSRR